MSLFSGILSGQGRLKDIRESCAGLEGWACANLASLHVTHPPIDRCAGGKPEDLDLDDSTRAAMKESFWPAQLGWMEDQKPRPFRNACYEGWGDGSCFLNAALQSPFASVHITRGFFRTL